MENLQKERDFLASLSGNESELKKDLKTSSKSRTASISDLATELKEIASQLNKGADLIEKDLKDKKSDFSEAWRFLTPAIPNSASKLMKLKRQWNLK